MRTNFRIRRLVENPLTMLLCLAFVLLSLKSLPPWSPARDSTAAKLRDWFSRAPAPGDRGEWSTSVLVRRREFGFEVMLPDEDSWGDAVTALATAPGDTQLFTFEYAAKLRGLWAFTTLEEKATLRAHAPSRIVNTSRPEELSSARAPAAQFLAQRRHIPPELADQLTQGDVGRRVTLREGWALNILTLLASAGFLWSLLFFPRSFAELRARHRASALRQRRCPACGYALGALEAQYCPECGQSLSSPA